MIGPRPPWYRPFARRRWDRTLAHQIAARARLRTLLRQSPDLRRVAENLSRAFSAALPSVREAAANIRRAAGLQGRIPGAPPKNGKKPPEDLPTSKS